MNAKQGFFEILGRVSVLSKFLLDWFERLQVTVDVTTPFGSGQPLAVVHSLGLSIFIRNLMGEARFPRKFCITTLAMVFLLDEKKIVIRSFRD